MSRKVAVLPQAELDATEYAAYISEDSASAAHRWLVGLEGVISELEDMAEAWPEIPERGAFRRKYRHRHHHSHRIVFFIDEESNTVVIARIYHAARKELSQRDLDR